ncbi:MAG TPA: hypothetical protein VGA89_02025 [Patescibacteria group bacterium]|jgi:hypothetical protein
MTERKVNSPLTPEEVGRALDEVLAKLMVGTERTPGRIPIRAIKIIEAFKQRPEISLEDLAKEFSQNANPKKAASTAIGWFNKLLRKFNTGLVIERKTIYRLRRK